MNLDYLACCGNYIIEKYNYRNNNNNADTVITFLSKNIFNKEIYTNNTLVKILGNKLENAQL